MLRRALLLLAIGCALPLGACSLLLGEGFTDPDAIARANDADATTDSGGAGDGPSVAPDAGSNDAAPTIDAATGCPVAKVSFCDDFNRDGPKGDWTNVTLEDGGTLAIDKVAAGNASLRSGVTVKGGRALLTKVLSIVPKKVHLELTVLLDSFSSEGGVHLAGIVMSSPNGGPPTIIYLYAEPANVFFVQQIANGVNYVRDVVPISKNTKHRIVVDLVFGGPLKLTVDAKTVIDRNAETFLFTNIPSVNLGADSIDGTGTGLTMMIDDFVFTAD